MLHRKDKLNLLAEFACFKLDQSRYNPWPSHYGEVTECEPPEAEFIRLTSDNDHSLVSYSDYSGSTVERSNYDAIVKECDRLGIAYITVHGGYDTNDLLFPVVPCRKIEQTCNDQNRFDYDGSNGITRLETLKQWQDDLRGYCLFDEEEHSRLEQELQEEAVRDWVLSELNGILTARLQEETGDEDAEVELTEDQFWKTYSEHELYNEVEFICEDAVSAWIRVSADKHSNRRSLETCWPWPLPVETDPAQLALDLTA